MFFFQHPLADLRVAMDDLAFIDLLWHDWSPGYDATDDLRAAEGLRCAIRPTSPPRSATTGPASGRHGTRCPTRCTQAAQDARRNRTSTSTAPTTAAWASRWPRTRRTMVPDNVTVEIVDGAGHFLHLEQPDEVNRRVLDFLTS